MVPVPRFWVFAALLLLIPPTGQADDRIQGPRDPPPLAPWPPGQTDCIGVPESSPEVPQITNHLLGTSRGAYVAGLCADIDAARFGPRIDGYEVNANLLVPGEHVELRLTTILDGQDHKTCPGNFDCGPVVRINQRLCTPVVNVCGLTRDGPIPTTSWSIRFLVSGLCTAPTRMAEVDVAATDLDSGRIWHAYDQTTIVCP